jgi:DNA-binding SARP family transcriptional activator
MHISAVLLGRWPHGATCTIAADGAVTHADEPFAHLVGTRWEGTSTEHLRHALRRHRARGTPAPSPEPEPQPKGDEPGNGYAQDQDEDQEQASSGELHAPTPHSVSVTVLGHISLSVYGTRVRPHRRSALEVLAYLAAHPAGVRLDAAVDTMWPADTGHRAIRRFHDACTAIRTACRPALGDLATQVIAHDNDLYRLNPDLVSCDLWRLHHLLDDATASDDPSVLVSNAAAGYEEFAADSDYVWADGPRVRLRTRLITAMLQSASRAETIYAKSILHRAAEIDPRDTDVAHQLVRLYLGSGDDRTARRIYDQHRKSLEEIGEDPEEKTASLLAGAELA